MLSWLQFTWLREQLSAHGIVVWVGRDLFGSLLKDVWSNPPSMSRDIFSSMGLLGATFNLAWNFPRKGHPVPLWASCSKVSPSFPTLNVPSFTLKPFSLSVPTAEVLSAVTRWQVTLLCVIFRYFWCAKFQERGLWIHQVTPPLSKRFWKNKTAAPQIFF